MPEIEFIVRRHADKAKGGEEWGGRTLVKDEVSPKGHVQATRAGRKGYANRPPTIVLRRVTNAIRTRQTSDGVMLGARYLAGAKITTIAPREDANFFGVTVADKGKWANAVAKGEDQGMRAFLRGEDVGLTETPHQLGERYATGVKSLLLKAQKHFNNKPVAGLTAEKYVVDVTAHAPGVGALAAYLMGRHEPDGSVKLATASLLKVSERFTEEVRVKVQLEKNGKIKSATAHFRGREKDVTRLFGGVTKTDPDTFTTSGR